MSEFAIRLKTAMEYRDINAADLAKKTGLHKSNFTRYFQDDGYSPKNGTIHKIANALGVSEVWLSTGIGGMTDDLNSLKKVQNQSEYIVFPVMGEIAAGYDKIAVEDWEGETIHIHIDNLKGRSKNDFIVLEVKGNSMFPEFQNGDKVLIQKQNSLDYSGQVGAIIYNNDCATLKKVEYKEGEDWLKLVPINPNFETEKIEGEGLEYCKVIGVPKLLIREYEQ